MDISNINKALLNSTSHILGTSGISSLVEDGEVNKNSLTEEGRKMVQALSNSFVSNPTSESSATYLFSLWAPLYRNMVKLGEVLKAATKKHISENSQPENLDSDQWSSLTNSIRVSGLPLSDFGLE